MTVSDGKGGTGTATVPVTVTAASCGTGSGYRDDFDGTALGAGWSVIRGDATLTVGGGKLSIPTQAGDLYQTTNTAKNIVLRTGPTGAFTMTAKINHKGLVQYQQAGIIVYNDDNNYVKLDRTATNTAPRRTRSSSSSSRRQRHRPQRDADHTSNLAATFPQDFYVRIVSNGTTLTGQYSTDGTTWTQAGRVSTASRPTPGRRLRASNAATTQVTPTSTGSR